jgi:hypothetical protein
MGTTVVNFFDLPPPRSSTHLMRCGMAALMSSPPAGSGRSMVTSLPTPGRRRYTRARDPARQGEDDRRRDERGATAHDTYTQGGGSHPLAGCKGPWLLDRHCNRDEHCQKPSAPRNASALKPTALPVSLATSSVRLSVDFPAYLLLMLKRALCQREGVGVRRPKLP